MVAAGSAASRAAARRNGLFDDDLPKKPKTHELGMILDAMSVEELGERIGLLEAEIARLRAAIELKRKSRDAAASVFKF